MTYADDVSAPGEDYEFDTDDDLDLDDEYDFEDEYEDGEEEPDLESPGQGTDDARRA